MGRSHPNLHVFLETLQKEEEYAESIWRLADLGEGPPLKKRKYAQNNARIERTVGRRYAEYKAEQEGVLDGDWDAGLLKYLKTLGHSTSNILS